MGVALRLVWVVGLMFAGGCTPGWYKRSADMQVGRILEQRKEQTLGYQPQVEAASTVDPRPVRRAYEKIPATPIAPPTTSPVEPVQVEVAYGPLGPENRWPRLPPPEDVLGLEDFARRGIEPRVLGPPSPFEAVQRLDVFRALHYAVNHSRSYQTQMEQVYLAALGVTLERHLFSPRPFARTSVVYSGGEADVAYRSALSATASAGVRQQLPYGGEIVAQTLVEFVDALSGNVTEGEAAAVALSASVPLLRGAGLVNLEPLIASERELVYTIRALEDFRRSFLVDIASRYFNLLTQQQALANRRVNYANLALLTERTEALYAAGRISFLEVQRSLQAQLGAENALIDAQEAYQSALDDFKVVLGMPIEQALQIVAVELEVAVPQVDAEHAVDQAIRYRLDLQTARDRIADAQRRVQVAENGLQADLDLTADVRVGNRVGTPAVDLDRDTITYTSGLTLDLPVDRLAERNVYRRSLIGLQQAQRFYDSVRDQVSADARAALRRIRAAQATLDLQRAGIALAQRRLEFANELLTQGKVNARDVVEAQSSLLAAQDAYDRARSQLQIQVLRYLRDTGTLRVDPQAGALGRAMEREDVVNETASPR